MKGVFGTPLKPFQVSRGRQRRARRKPRAARTCRPHQHSRSAAGIFLPPRPRSRPVSAAPRRRWLLPQRDTLQVPRRLIPRTLADRMCGPASRAAGLDESKVASITVRGILCATRSAICRSPAPARRSATRSGRWSHSAARPRYRAAGQPRSRRIPMEPRLDRVARQDHGRSQGLLNRRHIRHNSGRPRLWRPMMSAFR